MSRPLPHESAADLQGITPSAPEDRSYSQRQEDREPLWRHLVGDELRTLRRARGETLGAVAKRARVSPQYLSELERGGKEPSSEILAAIGEALDSSLLDLTSAIAGRLSETNSAASAPLRSEVALAA